MNTLRYFILLVSLTFGLSLVGPQLSHADVVFYKDKDGRTHFVSNKEKVPEEYRNQLKGQKLAPITKVKSRDYKPSGDSRYAIKSRKKIVMYVTSWCSVCVRAEKYMDQNKIAYTKYDVERDPRAHKEFKALGGRGVPLIKVGDRIMKGFDPRRLQAYIKN
jgi:glutaredoxin